MYMNYEYYWYETDLLLISDCSMNYVQHWIEIDLFWYEVGNAFLQESQLTKGRGSKCPKLYERNKNILRLYFGSKIPLL